MAVNIETRESEKVAFLVKATVVSQMEGEALAQAFVDNAFAQSDAEAMGAVIKARVLQLMVQGDMEVFELLGEGAERVKAEIATLLA